MQKEAAAAGRKPLNLGCLLLHYLQVETTTNDHRKRLHLFRSPIEAVNDYISIVIVLYLQFNEET